MWLKLFLNVFIPTINYSEPGNFGSDETVVVMVMWLSIDALLGVNFRVKKDVGASILVVNWFT